MQLAILTAVLAALAAAETGGGPVAGVAWRLLVIAGVALVAPAAALVGSWRLDRGAGQSTALSYDDDRRERASRRLQSVVVGLWMSSVLIVLFVAQWPRIVRGNWQLAGWPLVDELAILAPVIAPLLLVWAALYRLERVAQIAAFENQDLEPPPAQLGKYLWLHVRHHLGLILLPALAVVGAFDVLGLLKITSGPNDAAWWFAIPLLGTILLLMPLAVRRIWRTTPLAAGPLREQLEAICHAQRCRVREILVWHTDGYMANAAVVGFSRWLRYVLLTDVLIARLTPAEIAAVLRHELAHLRRWHLPLRLALLALPLAWWLAIKQVWPEIETAAEAAVASAGISAQLFAALALPVTMLAYALVVVGWYSRLLEHEADLAACLDDQNRLDPALTADFCQALTRIIGKSRESRAGQWLHPSLADRLRFLHRAAGSAAQSAFEQKLLRIRMGIAVAYAAALLLAACCNCR